jgi:peptidoglycan/xylan/chitin deacetylase (PgdA/CDA1 family)
MSRMGDSRTGDRFRSVILCYHAVSDTWVHPLSVRPAALRGHVQTLLGRGYVPVGVMEALEGRPRTFHVTFDDAFLNTFEGLDVLEPLGVQATVFACAALADEGRPFDAGSFATEANATDRKPTMTWDDLRSVVARGHDVGSHTLSHPALTTLDDVELERELGESRRRIEAELGRPCTLVAYPFGDHDSRVCSAARDAGYVAGFTQLSPGGVADPFATPRVNLYSIDGPRRAALKLSSVGWRLAAWRSRSRAALR